MELSCLPWYRRLTEGHWNWFACCEGNMAICIPVTRAWTQGWIILKLPVADQNRGGTDLRACLGAFSVRLWQESKADIEVEASIAGGHALDPLERMFAKNHQLHPSSPPTLMGRMPMLYCMRVWLQLQLHILFLNCPFIFCGCPLWLPISKLKPREAQANPASEICGCTAGTEERYSPLPQASPSRRPRHKGGVTNRKE